MKLVKVDRIILSAYQPHSQGGGTGGARSGLLRLNQLGAGGMLEETAANSLHRVAIRAEHEGIDLRITDALRGEPSQTAARQRWHLGKGPFALPWGQSWHGCGFAVDTDVAAVGDGYALLGGVFRSEGWSQVRWGLQPGDDEAWHWQRPPEGLTVEECHRLVGVL